MVASGPTTGFEYLEADRVSSLEYRAGFNTDGTWLNAGEYPRQQWYHHALSFDDATGICTWYINGESVGTMTGSRLFADYDEDLYVGDCKNGSQPFAGSIDDLRLYNYPLNSVEAASLYVEVTGGTACAEPLAYDLNDDCKMDLQDFALFAATWADCGLVPDCLP